jgi:replication-associated recombination protein RarA
MQNSLSLSAVTAGKKDVMTVIEHAKQNWNLGVRTILVCRRNP